LILSLFGVVADVVGLPRRGVNWQVVGVGIVVRGDNRVEVVCYSVAHGKEILVGDLHRLL